MKIEKLQPQELKIYYNKEGYPPLTAVSADDISVSFDSRNIIYTSTKFEEIKNRRNIFCFGDQPNCLQEDHEIEQLGYRINTYSHFTTDTSIDKTAQNTPYDLILIEYVKKK